MSGSSFYTENPYCFDCAPVRVKVSSVRQFVCLFFLLVNSARIAKKKGSFYSCLSKEFSRIRRLKWDDESRVFFFL